MKLRECDKNSFYYTLYLGVCVCVCTLLVTLIIAKCFSVEKFCQRILQHKIPMCGCVVAVSFQWHSWWFLGISQSGEIINIFANFGRICRCHTMSARAWEREWERVSPSANASVSTTAAETSIFCWGRHMANHIMCWPIVLLRCYTPQCSLL